MPGGVGDAGRNEGRDEPKEAPALHQIDDAAQALSWLHELAAEIAAAPNRRVAASLLALNADVIASLPEARRELLLTRLQDILAELPFCRQGQGRR